jgi:hypothetical protein
MSGPFGFKGKDFNPKVRGKIKELVKLKNGRKKYPKKKN